MSRLLAALFAISLAGCDALVSGRTAPAPEAGAPTAGKPPADKPAGAAPPAEAAEAKKAEPLDPLDAAIAAQEGYVYNPIGKRDPFRSFLATGTREEDDTPRTPLQRYDLDQYALVGVIWGIDRPRALVEDPENTGHVIEIGTYIGKNWGKVTQITSSGVVVTEEYQTFDGELVVNEIPMKLPDPTARQGGRP
jgi:type IV pilus assembly protein PilP